MSEFRQLKGAFTAMVTPLCEKGLDEAGLIALIRRQIEAGIAGLLFLGSTGEGETLTEEEQRRVIEIGVREAKGKTLVIAGTGSNATHEAIKKTKIAKELGVDAVLIVAPYFNKPTQEGIYRHFAAIAKEVDIPILVYNIQGRTGVNIETSTLLRIAGLPNVIGVKDSSGSVSQVGEVLIEVGKKYPSFTVLSGDDELTLPMMALGATGVISVVSNLVPEQIVALVASALEGRFFEARVIHEKSMPLFKAAFFETNPIPIKLAMELCGLAAGECRLPLCEMKPENQERMKKQLLAMGLIPFMR